jgi:hypothetical protein
MDKLLLNRGGLNLKLFKISLAWVRVSIICIMLMVAIAFAGRQPGVEKLVKKIITPSLASTGQEWVLELDKSYTLCGHCESVRTSYLSNELLQAAIQNNHGYQLKRIIGHIQVYGQSVPDYCPQCKSSQFLGISEHKVAVIRGTPEKPGPIREKTTIQISDLPQLELKDLQKGIPFQNGKEKLQLIEGLKGLSTN